MLTGGGAELKNIADYMQGVLGRAVRVGRPKTITGLPEAHSGPAFSTLVGLAMLAGERQRRHPRPGDGRGPGAQAGDRHDRPPDERHETGLLTTLGRRRIIIYGGLAAGVAALVFYLVGGPPEMERCERYLPVDQPLIAHAGGGLPTATHTNSLAAIEAAAAHGFRLIELDFRRTREGIALGHDPKRLSSLTLDELLRFLRQHPDISIVTDFKSDNLAGLRRLAELTGNMRTRFIPQIYRLEEFQPTMAMGYPRPILSVYRSPNFGWQFRANSVAVRAVTMPSRLRYLAGLVDHPVYLHTVNVPTPGNGLYTDCLVPMRAG